MGHGIINSMEHVHVCTLTRCSLSDSVVAVTVSVLVMAVPYLAVRVMSHSLPGDMLEKVADVLELVVVGTFGAGNGSPQISIQAMVSM